MKYCLEKHCAEVNKKEASQQLYGKLESDELIFIYNVAYNMVNKNYHECRA